MARVRIVAAQLALTARCRLLAKIISRSLSAFQTDFISHAVLSKLTSN